MTYIQASIDVSQLTGLAQMLRREREALAGGSDQGPIDLGLAAAGNAYMGSIRERYVRNSRGGGTWAPLAPSTLRRRRKGVQTQGAQAAGKTARILAARGLAPMSAAILIDSSNLLGSITSYATEAISDGVRVGTEVDYAQYHQEGGPSLPQREIFVEPDTSTRDVMTRAIELGYQRAVDLFGAPS